MRDLMLIDQKNVCREELTKLLTGAIALDYHIKVELVYIPGESYLDIEEHVEYKVSIYAIKEKGEIEIE